MRQILVALVAMLPFIAFGTTPKPPSNVESSSVSSAEQSQTQSSSPSVAVDSDGASIGFLLGGGASGSDSTAACLERRPSWGFGFRGDKTKLNEECWAEYLRQAEHQRAMDEARLEIERLRLANERLRLEIALSEAQSK